MWEPVEFLLTIGGVSLILTLSIKKIIPLLFNKMGFSNENLSLTKERNQYKELWFYQLEKEFFDIVISYYPNEKSTAERYLTDVTNMKSNLLTNSILTEEEVKLVVLNQLVEHKGKLEGITFKLEYLKDNKESIKDEVMTITRKKVLDECNNLFDGFYKDLHNNIISNYDSIENESNLLLGELNRESGSN